MELIMNQLPVKTWNHLRMNERKITLDDVDQSCIPIVKLPESGIIWDTEDSDETIMKEIETGMGTDLNRYIQGGAVGNLRSMAGDKVEEAAVIEFSYLTGMRAANCLNIYVEKNSKLSVVVLLHSPEKGEGIAALQTRIHAEKGANVKVYVVQLLNDDFLCLNDIGIRCEEGSCVELEKLELGAGQDYAGTAVELRGEDSSFKSKIGYHVQKNQKLDMNYVANHYGKRTQSLMEASGVMEDGSFKIFRGTVDFKKGASGASGTENEKVLLLGDELVNQTIPLILCQEDDVEGAHGATIGHLDEKIMFFLKSRGFSEDDAQQMIAQAGIDMLCDRIPVEEVRQQIHAFELTRGDYKNEGL